MRRLVLGLACGLTLAAAPAFAFEGCGGYAPVTASTTEPTTVASTEAPATPAPATIAQETPRLTSTAEISTPKPAAN